MSASPHRLILASAGTGKTYELTGHYLGLLVRGVPPERILATTFTRKAAGEILDRVLMRLLEASQDDKAREALSAQVSLPLDAQMLTQLLAQCARRVNRFRVRTLDAFFAQLSSLYALELGLPLDWRIAEDVLDVARRRDAIAAALAEANVAEIVSLLRDLQSSEAKRGIERELLAAVDNMREIFLDSMPEAWDSLIVPAALRDEDLAQLRSKLEGFEVPKTQAGGSNKTWASAKGKLLAAIDGDDWSGVLRLGLVEKVLAGEVKFSRVDIPADFRELIESLNKHVASVLIDELRTQNLATRDWLERFEVAYAALKQEDGAYLFGDLPRLLDPSEVDPLNDRELLWYRLDGQIDHILLDEFQDTSPLQSRILERLSEEILSEASERSFFCVGDVKQSIYRWREAEPRLLACMHERHPVLEPEELSRSWRSSQVILDTVNEVFAQLDDQACFDKKEAREQAARRWSANYPHHEAARPELPGAASLLEAQLPDGDEAATMPVLRLAAERASQIAKEAPGASIGILLRSKKSLPTLIFLLRREGLNASGEGGNELVDSEAVLHLLSLLQLCDHPGDSMAAFHLGTSALGEGLGVSWLASARPESKELRAEWEGRRAEFALSMRARIANEGYGEFCRSMREFVQAGYGSWDVRRFDQLIELALQSETQVGPRLVDFVDLVRITRVEDPTMAQVKVMTIHASKGLEFDAVILPDLDGLLIRSDKLYSSRPDPLAPVAEVSHYRNHNVCNLDPDGLGRLRDESEARSIEDALCVLYVAMTRAVYRLDMLVAGVKPGSKAGGKSYAGLLKQVLARGDAPADGVLWEHPGSRADWYPPAESASGETVDESQPLRVDALVGTSNDRRLLPRRSPSALSHTGSRPASELLAAPNVGAMARGSLIHRWMEEIEWLEDAGLNADAMLKIGEELESDRGKLELVWKEFEASLAQPDVAALLSRSRQDQAPEEVLELWRERSFAVVMTDENHGECLWTGAFDRVLIRRSKDRIVAAEVIDYKTDRVKADNLRARAERYLPQLQSYSRILAQMLGLEIGKVRARLAFLAAGQVVELPSA